MAARWWDLLSWPLRAQIVVGLIAALSTYFVKVLQWHKPAGQEWQLSGMLATLLGLGVGLLVVTALRVLARLRHDLIARGRLPDPPQPQRHEDRGDD